MKRKKKTKGKKLKTVVLSRKQLLAEIARLEQKCHDRSNECYLLKVQKDALEEKLVTIRRAYNMFDSEFVRAIRA
jgi:hypothetical protein